MTNVDNNSSIFLIDMPLYFVQFVCFCLRGYLAIELAAAALLSSVAMVTVWQQEESPCIMADVTLCHKLELIQSRTMAGIVWKRGCEVSQRCPL